MAYNTTAYKKPSNILTKYNMTHGGKVYPILGETYSIKDELKALGAVFSRGIGWFFVDKMMADKCGRPYCELPVSEIVRSTGPNKFDFIYEEELKAMIEPFQPKVERVIVGSADSDYVGEIGQEIEVDVDIKKVFAFNGRYGESYMFLMEDEDGNVFVWNTKSRNADDYPEETRWTVRGKVKEHKEYDTKDGVRIKQTVLTYCKMR